jgi:hypothetical protein
MKLSLRALDLLFDRSEEELSVKALTDKWKEDKEGNGKVLNYIVPETQIDKQLDYILSDPDLISKCSAMLSQNPPLISELESNLSESVYAKFEKLINVEFEKKVYGKFEKKNNAEFEKNRDFTQSLRNFSNNMNISVQDTDTKEDNHCKKDHCKKPKTTQLPVKKRR